MSEVLKDYFYTGISFSLFFIDEGVFLCLKIEKSKNPLIKLSYVLKLRKYLKRNPETDKCLIGNEKYLVYQNITSLNNASVLFSTNKEHKKLYKKLKNDKRALVCESFDLDDLTKESLDEPILLVVKNEESKVKYQELIKSCKEVNIIYLDKIKEETNREIMFDAIKVKLLQYDTNICFIEEGMYANYIANFIFTLNKIAIIY